MVTEDNERKPPDLVYFKGTYVGWRHDLHGFVERYNREYAGKMPRIALDDRRYRELENAGKLAAWFVTCGTLAGVLSYVIDTSRHYTPDHLIALHDFFYVEPEFRSGLVPLNLYRTAETGLREMGVKRIFMVDHIRFVNRGTAYRRMGYLPVEVTYEKVLEKVSPRPQSGGN